MQTRRISPQPLPTREELLISCLGAAHLESPLARAGGRQWVPDTTRVRLQPEVGPEVPHHGDLSFEKAGPRERIFFDPARTSAALVTCGGLSPGLNNVIRSAYFELTHNYGVARVLGIRNGYAGLVAGSGFEPLELTHERVESIHNHGGTMLGSSRGAQEPGAVVDFLEEQGIDILFCIGGDGTQRGAHAICEEVVRRGLEKSIVGIPKTIDNDIPYVDMSFGYATALEEAAKAIHADHVEARGMPNGIGVVKLMGRDAGFIAAGAAVVSQEANYVLVPEVAFPLEGDNGLLASLEERLARRGHAVIVVAEGAGRHLFGEEQAARGGSGNASQRDIGLFLCDRIESYFNERDIDVGMKYIDPSYLIRSVPANAWDRFSSDRMARFAVHAAMAGKTDVMIGMWNQTLIHVPISTAVREKKQMELSSDLWSAVLATTGQPRW